MRIGQADHKEDSPCVGTGGYATADAELDAALLQLLSDGEGPLDGNHHGALHPMPDSCESPGQAALLNELISFDFDPSGSSLYLHDHITGTEHLHGGPVQSVPV